MVVEVVAAFVQENQHGWETLTGTVKTVGSREVMMDMLKLHQHLVLLLVMFHISQSSPRD